MKFFRQLITNARKKKDGASKLIGGRELFNEELIIAQKKNPPPNSGYYDINRKEIHEGDKVVRIADYDDEGEAHFCRQATDERNI